MSQIQQPTKGAITARGVPPLRNRNRIPRRSISRIVVAALLVVAACLASLAPAQANPGPPQPSDSPTPPPGPAPGTGMASLLGKVTADDAAMQDYFGYRVAVSGDTAVVGAYLDDDGGESSGSAYVYVRDGLQWTQQAKLTASDAAITDVFGISVAISGDTILIGAYEDDDGGIDSGSAYVFERTGTVWSQQAKLTAPDASAADDFGFDVALDGDTAVVGAFFDDDDGTNSGSAYVFFRSAQSWALEAKLTASDAAAGDLFGSAVAVSGDTIAVSAVQNGDAGPKSGSAYVFARAGTAWLQQAKLTAADADPGDLFGSGLALDGNTVVVGASGKLFAKGAAYVFFRAGTVWSEQAKLMPADGAIGDSFGQSVGISGDSIIGGAHGDDDDGVKSGSASVFSRIGTVWTQKEKLTAADADELDLFGLSVAISGITVVAGAFHDDDDGLDSGSAYMFVDTVADTDGDGVSDYDEIIAGTDPSDPKSVSMADRDRDTASASRAPRR